MILQKGIPQEGLNPVCHSVLFPILMHALYVEPGRMSFSAMIEN
jgi:hypothetical protein